MERKTDSPAPPSSSVTVTLTVYRPGLAYAWFPPTEPEPFASWTAPAEALPSSQFQTAVWVSGRPGSVKLALVAMSAFTVTGSLGAAMDPTVGATFITVTVVTASDESPRLSVARILIARLPGPSSPAAEKVVLWPGVSNIPSPSRSHANVSASPPGSLPEAVTRTEAPSSTVYGPPASAVGGWLIFATIASKLPTSADCQGFAVGKSLEKVEPVT